MTYVKYALVGIVTGLGSAVIWAILRVVMVVLPVIEPSGSGGLASVSGGVSEGILMPGIMGFALGFYLMWRRQRARTAKL